MIELDGVVFTPVCASQALAMLESNLSQGKGGRIVTPNFQMLASCAKSVDLLKLVNSHELVLCDSQILYWASKLVGLGLPERVTGADLVPLVLELSASHRYKIALLGGDQFESAIAASKIRSLYPGIDLVLVSAPQIDDPGSSSEVIIMEKALVAVRPDIVLLGFGFPKQEQLTSIFWSTYNSAWYVNVGMGIGFFAGSKKRAPRIMQKLGLEWAWRLAQEPKRLSRRYLCVYPGYLPRFLLHLLKVGFKRV